MAIVPAAGATGVPVSQPWWQVEAWSRGQLRWMNQGEVFNNQTETLYWRCISQRNSSRSSNDSEEYVFVYTGNTRAGPITYVLDFARMTQTNRNTSEVLRIRRVATMVLDGHPE